ncbi:hypothetical protein [Simplicispira suum]|uniref:hypothetical protein n=1 Tax=Simplicispira suum TaxID=2109915 RepID=UPI0011B265B2|nr:hypothetical protein [Simplicispira suum]
MKSFAIVFSNYTAMVMAWEGTAQEIKKYLGNREILGEVLANSAETALTQWRSDVASLSIRGKRHTSNRRSVRHSRTGAPHPWASRA